MSPMVLAVCLGMVRERWRASCARDARIYRDPFTDGNFGAYEREWIRDACMGFEERFCSLAALNNFARRSLRERRPDLARDVEVWSGDPPEAEVLSLVCEERELGAAVTRARRLAQAFGVDVLDVEWVRPTRRWSTLLIAPSVTARSLCARVAIGEVWELGPSWPEAQALIDSAARAGVIAPRAAVWFRPPWRAGREPRKGRACRSRRSSVALDSFNRCEVST